MNNCMLAKQDNLSRCTDKQLFFDTPSVQCQLLDHATNRLSGTIDTDVLVLESIELDSACSDKRALEVVQEIVRVFDSYAQTNEILW